MMRSAITARRAMLGAAAVAAVAVAAFAVPVRAGAPAQALPMPAQDVAPAGGLQVAVFSGGCFWGVQAVFQHVTGVTQAVSGYSGGDVANPGYERVSSGTTGHAESVKVTFDPSRVSYGKLLQIFFTVALDPTELNRQGPDRGTQYRSELFVTGPDQDRVAHAYLAQLAAAQAFDKPIVTRIDPAGAFFPAEDYHQDYLVHHPNASYIVVNDLPKVENLHRLFPQVWQTVPVTVGKPPTAS